MSNRCDRPGCPDPDSEVYGNHYHCGRCTSPKITSMMGHLQMGEFSCKPEELIPPQPPTPESDRVLKVAGRTQVAGEFLEWAAGEGLLLCSYNDRGDFYPIHESVERLLARWQGINLNRVEQEKKALLEWIRKQN